MLAVSGLVPVGTASAQNPLQDELQRREAQLNESMALIHEGDLLRKQNMLVEAMGAYQAAYDVLPNAPATSIMRATARDKYTEVANTLTRELGKEGRFEEARRVNKTVREPVFNPDNVEAKVLEKELDDPVIYPPAMSPGHAMDVDEVTDLLTRANGLMGLGDFDRAQKAFEEVLKIDRYNSAARRGLERAEQYRAGLPDERPRRHPDQNAAGSGSGMGNEAAVVGGRFRCHPGWGWNVWGCGGLGGAVDLDEVEDDRGAQRAAF